MLDGVCYQLRGDGSATVAALKPFTKYAGEVDDPDNVAEAVANAIASTAAAITHPARVSALGTPPAGQIEQAARLIRAARQPVLLVGVRAGDPAPCAALRDLLAVTDLPVVETFQVAGVVSHKVEDHFFGRVGLFRNQPGDILIAHADVVVTVGFDSMEYDPRMWNIDPDRTLIHIDELPADLDEHYQPTLELRGDIAAALTELTPLLSGLRLPDTALAAAADQRAALVRIDEDARNHPETELGLNPAVVVLKIRELVEDDATIACAVGSNYIYMARHFRVYEPRRLLFSNGQQTLGVALPWAMAAAMVRPGTHVVSVSGDGGFLFSAQELETATRLGLGFTHVIFRDNAYDMVAFQEVMKYGRKSGVQLGDFDIRQYAGAFGATGIRVSSMHEFENAFKQSLNEPGITILDVWVDYSHTIDLYAQLHEAVLN